MVVPSTFIEVPTVSMNLEITFETLFFFSTHLKVTGKEATLDKGY